MTETLTIDRLGHRADGVAQVDELSVFVPYTLPQEVVETEPVSGHPERRNLVRVLKPSPARITPFCPHFGICGGCQLQHWREDAYRDWKRSIVVETLTQADIAAPVAALIDAHGAGRRRAIFHARPNSRHILAVGFAALRAHQIVPIDHCPVLAPSLAGAVEVAWAIAEALTPSKKPLDIQVAGTQNGIDIDVRGSGALTPAQTAALARLCDKHRVARITRHGELVVQHAAPVIAVGRAMLALPPGAFLQPTDAGEATLADLVLRYVGKAKTVADLFCGVGPFSLRLAERASVVAMDADESALAALTQAARAPGLKPIETQRRDLFRRPLTAPELASFDAAVFDPPRQGAQAQAQEFAKSRVKTIVAVSCNPATFARDARLLLDGGFKLAEVTPVDQFKYTAHLELVAAFTR